MLQPVSQIKVLSDFLVLISETGAAAQHRLRRAQFLGFSRIRAYLGERRTSESSRIEEMRRLRPGNERI